MTSSTFDAPITIPPDVLFHDLGGEAVALNLSTGAYYGFDAVATRMWTLLAEGRSPAAVIDAVLEEYEAGRAEVARDLSELVDRLVAYGLIQLGEPT